jgi:hypothetical protein
MEEEEEEDEGDDDYEFNETGDEENNERLQESGNKSASTNKNKAFRHECHNIILNLSKNTLRNILMLICDEGVKS